MIFRFSYAILLLIASLALPWWVFFIFAIFLSAYYPWYYEGLLAFLSYELIYGPNTSTLWLTCGYLLFLPVVEFIKSRVYVFN